MREYSDITRRKIKIYFASNYLFDRGKSFPQVLDILSDYEQDGDLLTDIVEQAMNDKWRTIFNEAQRLFSENKTYQEVVDALSTFVSDPELVHFICEKWYAVKTLYVDNLIESDTNIWEGVQWLIISLLGTCGVFYFDASLFSKIVWPAALIGALITWAYGLHQKKLANAVKTIIEQDYSNFGRLI